MARLPQEHQTAAFEQCWRKDWQEAKAHLLPARHLSQWIEKHLYLTLADAPFSREDPSLNPAAGACTSCPRRSGYNTSLFSDVEGDPCLDAPCYHAKVEAHIGRELAARPEMVTIETSWRQAKEHRPGSLQKHSYRELDIPDAEPPCPSTRTAIIVFGKRTGTTLTVCTDEDCPVHDPATAAMLARQQKQQTEPPVFSPAETELEKRYTPEEQAEAEEQRRQEKEEQEWEAEERRQAITLRQEEYEAEQLRKEALRAVRNASFERILADAPATFSHAQMRVFLHALITVDEDVFSDAASDLASENTTHLASDELLLAHLDQLPDEKLAGFALRLALTQHKRVPFEAQADYLAEAETAFPAPQTTPAKKRMPKKRPPLIKALKKTAKKKAV